MKRLILILLTVAISPILHGYNHSYKKEQIGNEAPVSKIKIEQKVIITDSVDVPLPPEAKNVDSMPRKSDPQNIPNVNLRAPIVITKMPYSTHLNP